MPSDPFDTPDHQGFKFDPTVNLGHIITFIGFLMTCAMMYMSLDKRVVVLEESRVAQLQVDRRQEETIAEIKRTGREDMREINQKLDRLIERAK